MHWLSYTNILFIGMSVYFRYNFKFQPISLKRKENEEVKFYVYDRNFYFLVWTDLQTRIYLTKFPSKIPLISFINEVEYRFQEHRWLLHSYVNVDIRLWIVKKIEFGCVSYSSNFDTETSSKNTVIVHDRKKFEFWKWLNFLFWALGFALFGIDLVVKKSFSSDWLIRVHSFKVDFKENSRFSMNTYGLIGSEKKWNKFKSYVFFISLFCITKERSELLIHWINWCDFNWWFVCFFILKFKFRCAFTQSIPLN